MKYFGSVFECEQERKEDLMRAYHEQIIACDIIRMPDIFKRLVNMPSKRFWVSEERAAIVIASMLRGDTLSKMRPTKREMFFEIYSRVLVIRKANPNMSVYEMVSKVVRQPAPKFYLTPDSAKVMFYKIKKQWFEKRMQRWQH